MDKALSQSSQSRPDLKGIKTGLPWNTVFHIPFTSSTAPVLNIFAASR
jgi:hypothetical protein